MINGTVTIDLWDFQQLQKQNDELNKDMRKLRALLGSLAIVEDRGTDDEEDLVLIVPHESKKKIAKLLVDTDLYDEVNKVIWQDADHEHYFRLDGDD